MGPKPSRINKIHFFNLLINIPYSNLPVGHIVIYGSANQVIEKKGFMNQTTNADEQVLARVTLLRLPDNTVVTDFEVLDVEPALQVLLLEELLVDVSRAIWQLSPQNKLDAPPTMPIAGPEMGVEAIAGENTTLDTPKIPEGPKCQKCSKAYNPARHWQKFCSAKCRMEYANQERQRLVRMAKEL